MAALARSGDVKCSWVDVSEPATGLLRLRSGSLPEVDDSAWLVVLARELHGERGASSGRAMGKDEGGIGVAHVPLGALHIVG